MVNKENLIIDSNDLVLVTGSNGFIGCKVVEKLLEYGFNNIRCLVRLSSNLDRLKEILKKFPDRRLEIITGNLLDRDDCIKLTEETAVVFHLAAGRGQKAYPSAFLNSVVTTRNLLDAILEHRCLKRFVNVSSFAVYSTKKIPSGGLLDETCPIENKPALRGEAYCYAKVKQDELLLKYMRTYKLPCVIVRPGAVYGPGNKSLTGRIGIDTFGIFLHLGGSNIIPLSYVDNCAEAIVLAGIMKGIDGEVFNIVDDDLPTSMDFLKMYKKNVEGFVSVYIPKPLSWILCFLWEKYSLFSSGQLPAVFNRNRWSADWKGNRYSNDKLKQLTGWKPQIPFDIASKRYFEYCKGNGGY